MRGTRRRGARNLVLAMAIAGVPVVARAADSWSISIGVREISTNPAVGSDGGTTGSSIEWVNLDGQSIIADGAWHQYTWNFGSDPVTSFNGGNGVLSSAFNKGTLEHIRIVNSGGNVGGAIQLRIDDIVNTVSGTPTTVTGFEAGEGFSTTLASSSAMFREPIFSGTTLGNMSMGLNSTLVSTIPHTGSQSLAARWSFVPDGSTSKWLRLTTNNAAVKPNPTIDFTSGNSLSIWMRANVTNPSGTRAFGIDVSSNQGTGIDWNKVAAPQTSGGAGLTFAFVRATRGGTSGTSTTGAMRVDDSTFSYNITNAKAAGMLTGPYHFGRPDMWTAGDVNGNGDSPSTVGTPEDEARHMLETAGQYMKPGYMRPVYDLEDGDVEQNNAQMTAFVNRFASTLMKYKGPGAKLIVYAGSDYASTEVNSSIAQYPLWMPRWPSDPNPWADDPYATESSYGVWNDGIVGNPMPWSFWQYNSPDVYVPGVGGAAGITHNDIDVAHGDVNYVKGFMVQGSIWDGSSSAVWTTAANWDTNVEPISTTEVLFDAGIPGTGATITLSSGRAASGIYFADNYTLTGGSLTLNDGRIDVDAGKGATINTDLSAPNGFRKVGTGSLTHSGGTSNVTGIAQVLQGTMRVTGGSIAVTGNLLVNPELTQFDKSLVAPFPTVGQITNSSLTIAGGSVSAPAAFVGGSSTVSGANATLTVSSGSLSITGALKIWNSTLPLVDSKVNFSGGSMSLGSLNTDGDPASFNWTGGQLTIGGDNSSSTFSATGSGGAALVKAGTGALTLTGVNTYLGPTTVNAGTLRLGVNNALSGSTAMTVASGATFDLNGFSETLGSLAGAGNVVLGSGAAAFTVGTNSTSTSYSGVISGTGSFSKSGGGTMTLSGSNTYSGPTTIGFGTLKLGASDVLPSSTALTILTGMTLDMNGFSNTIGSLAGAGNVALGGGTLTTGGNNTSTSHSGVISGSGALIKTGSGNMTLSGASSYSGPTTINAGILSSSADSNLGNPSGVLTINNGGTFSGTGSFSSARNWVIGSVDMAVNVATGITVTNAGVISGGGGFFNKRGAGTLVLSGNSTYSGYLNLASGTVKLGVDNALPPGSRLDAISGAGSLDMAGFNQTLISANAFSFINSGASLSTLTITGPNVYTLSGTINGNIAVVYGASSNVTVTGNNTYTGGTTINGIVSIGADNRLGDSAAPVVFGGGTFVPTASFSMSRPINIASTALFQGFATSLSLSGVISGPGTLFNNGGTLVLSGVNTYAGGTGMAAGQLSVSADNNLGDPAGPLTFYGGAGTLLTTAGFLTNRTVTLNDFSGDGTIDTSSGTTLSVAGVISGSGNLVKAGAGTLLASAANTYTGQTKVNDGLLQIVQSSRTSSALNIADGATMALTPRTSGVKTLQVGTIDLNTTGTLDLADNDLVIDTGNFGGFSYIQQLVNTGLGNPAGPGIVSSTANGSQILALFDNSVLPTPMTSWNGGTISSTAVVGKYTYFGDVNLDGQVTGDDYTLIDANLNTDPPVGAEWMRGDANRDGIVTGDDYTTIDSNLGNGVGNPLSPNALTSVPEPCAVGLLIAAGVLGFRRRRNQ